MKSRRENLCREVPSTSARSNMATRATCPDGTAFVPYQQVWKVQTGDDRWPATRWRSRCGTRSTIRINWRGRSKAHVCLRRLCEKKTAARGCGGFDNGSTLRIYPWLPPSIYQVCQRTLGSPYRPNHLSERVSSLVVLDRDPVVSC